MGSEKLLFRLEQPHGSGDIYISWQPGSGQYLATTGNDSMVNIFDRYGQIHDRIRLPGLCTAFAWDSDGDLFAIISSQSSQLTLWDSNTSKKHQIDVRLKDAMTCLVWAKKAPLLAVGTIKGNVSIYNHHTAKRTPIIGKHTKKITCGKWSSENLLALGSEDKTISVSNVDGDTLRVISLRGEPLDVQFSEMKMDERAAGQNTVSVVVGKKTLYLYNLLDPDNPVELAFQGHYGPIIGYKWFGDGYILLGFGSGYFIAISTHIKEVGQELFQVRNHKNTLNCIAICPKISKAASCGDNSVKVHDLNNLQETSSVLSLNQEAGLERIEWSEDGQLLAVCTSSGSLNVYVSQVALLVAVCAPRIIILSSLTEISLYNYTRDRVKFKPIPIRLETEPVFIGVGPYHLAAGLNNRLWLYDLTRPQPGVEDAPLLLSEKQYLGTIESVKLNTEYASVLFEGKIQLHMIEPPEVCHEDRETIMFPDANSTYIITCHALTPDFLVFGTDLGQIVHFFIEEWSLATEYEHAVGISAIYTDPAGTRLIFIDFESQAYVYNATIAEIVEIPAIPTEKIDGVTWDSHLNDRNIFILFNETEICTYLYIKSSTSGARVEKIGVTKLVSKQIPLLMYAGEVMSATAGGQLSQLLLSTHDSINTGDERDTLEGNFIKQLALHRFHAAWKTCKALDSKAHWLQLADAALENLEIEFAMRIHKQLENVNIVWSLESLMGIEDTKLLCGYLKMFRNEFDEAQEWFLASRFPVAALEMRRDLLQWDMALQLAKKMAPEQVALISREYAQQLEFTGNYSEAHIHYEKGLQEDLSKEHTFTCKAGIARSALHCNNIRHGLSIALEQDNKQLSRECAEILDKNKHLAEAALLFEKSGIFERAAINYIKLKNWTKVGELLPNITSNKIHLAYAVAKEQEGKYQEAADAYHTAKDFDAVVRLQLEHLNNPEIAVELVQETKSTEGAKLVARFFQNLNDFASAIKFLVLSKCNEEAYDLAKKHGKMPLYGEILLESVTPDEIRPLDFIPIANHFESERNFLLAGKYYYHAREYTKAMNLFLKAAKLNSKEKDAVTGAIDVVASSKDETLANQLIEFLLGETDGMPKNPKFLFRLYMARKQYRDASKSALIIANDEQINGNYRNAHDVLFAMYQELKQNGIKIPYEMQENLMLLHSYILVRLHVKRGDHEKGARMLIRVANNISRFPSHIVSILTSTVIECHRAGLKFAAYKYATQLMNPEYRKSIDAKYAKKIEAVVRKPPKNGELSGDPVEALTPCPYCANLLPQTEILCNSCKNNIPFCIVTGRHIEVDDLTACPECDFPALRSHFIEILDGDNLCPMCSEKVDLNRLQPIADWKNYLHFE